MLAPGEPSGEQEAAIYCLSTNGDQMALPILLVPADRSEGRDRSAEKATVLPWCEGDNGGPGSQARSADRMPAGLFLIRPE